MKSRLDAAVNKAEEPHSYGVIGYDWLYVVDYKDISGVRLIRYIGEDSDVVIPESIDGVAVRKIDKDILGYSHRINTITIPDTVLEIDKNDFYHKAITIRAKKNSFAAEYALARNILFEEIE